MNARKYSTQTAAKTAATKLSKKTGKQYEVKATELNDGYEVVETGLLVVAEVTPFNDAQGDANLVAAGWTQVEGGGWMPGQEVVASITATIEQATGMSLAEVQQIAEGEGLVGEVMQPTTRQPKLVTLSFPVTTVSNTYVGARHDGKEIWFDKKSLDSFEIAEQEGVKLVTLTMARSKAVRRKLVEVAA
jgi:hypothetical protein